MTSEFFAGFVEGFKNGPRLFFAPLIGAFKGAIAEARRGISAEN